MVNGTRTVYICRSEEIRGGDFSIRHPQVVLALWMQHQTSEPVLTAALAEESIPELKLSQTPLHHFQELTEKKNSAGEFWSSSILYLLALIFL